MNRRQFLLAGAAAGVAGALTFRPDDNGDAYTPYFEQLNRSLKRDGSYVPSMLVDLDALDENIKALKSTLNPEKDFRIVAKSLPSPQLLGYIMEKADTNKLMVFHQPFLSQIARDYPDSDLLLGKPMPVKAAERFYQQQGEKPAFDAQSQLQWLIDSEHRLNQYLALAKQLSVKMRINIELDVGLHRGGVQSLSELNSLLTLIEQNGDVLTFAGFMGYDAHVVKVPGVLKSPQQAFDESQQFYQASINFLYHNFPALKSDSLCFNGAGSPTLALHREGSVANELSAGSCLVKPSSFDVPTLAQFQPAAYIATPVLKKMAGTRLPSAEFARDLFSMWDKNMQQTFFIYGGNWQAEYESPRGLQDNTLYGQSTNQQIVNGSDKVKLFVDDHVFLRPAQSEAVFLQFGQLKTLRDGRLLDNWPILQQA
ncbi:alanine racemase [Thalassomonas actiniarum]|uniref:Alanine racemase n=1 Tax=Thalassomonas actiniarum TaxID=485447 RepID=A0AAE9YKY7_9GAMM|nr:alanine racemase [Thalassomonas actiniarum]WDD97096.1 alanine racemase [Thalassomonas actiniarum]